MKFIVVLINKIKKYSSVIISMAGIVLLLVYNSIFNTWGYLTNDDISIQATLSGLYLGKPFPVHQFVHFFLGYFISGLYRICPVVQWWFFYSVALQCIGIFLITFSMFELTKRKGINYIYTIILIGVLYMSLFIYPTGYISFTTVPVLLSGGLLSYLLMHILIDDEQILVNNNLRLYIMSLIILAICIFHRSESGLSFIPYLLLMWLCYYLRIRTVKNKSFFRFVVQAFTFVLLSAIICISNDVYSSSFNGNEFVEFNTARAAYIDYPHDYYEENPDLFEKAGWSKELSKIVWYFADERVTTESFRIIADNSIHHRGSSTVRNWSGHFTTLLGRTQDRCWMLVHVILLAVTITLFLNYKNTPFYYAFYLISVNAGTLILFLFLMTKGRLITRAVFCIAVPLLVSEIIVLLLKLDKVKIGPVTILVFFLIALSLVTPLLNTIRVDDRYKEQSHLEARDIYNYVINNDDYIFVAFPGEIADQTIGDIYLQKKPTNLIDSGGSCFHSKYNKECAKINGMDSEFRTEMLKEGRFHMIFKDIYKPGCFILFYQYLANDYNAIGFDFKRFGDNLYDVWYVFDGQSYSGNCYTVKNDTIIKIQ